MSSSGPDTFSIMQQPKQNGKKVSTKPKLRRQGSITAFGSKIKRNMTEGCHQNFEEDDGWGKTMLDSVHEKQQKGVEGDIPGKFQLRRV